MCIDAHLVGKNTLANFRSLFTFTGALFLVMNNAETYLSKSDQHGDLFSSLDAFQASLVHLHVHADTPTPLDLAALPSLILSNMSSMPRLFR